MSKLRISADLALPEDAVTRTFVVYGGKGKGKTNFGSVLVEELAKLRLRFCVTDPLDVWWGLQHGKTKDSEGIDVVILGGAHGDIAITPDAGEIVADFVADEPVNTVIVMRHPDGRMWTNGERIRFMAKLVRRLFARQGERRLPVMLVIDEAGRFVPQIAQKGDADINECIGAIEELVEWGRNVGIGACLITQRSARMNKSVSELAECMIAFQTAGPLSIAAIVDWFGEHIPKARQNELVGILRELPVGRALVVSPEWLHFEGEAQIRLRETFDSSATPKAGGALRAPGRARKPDLEKYRVRMAETIERAKADDPRALRAALAAKDKQIAKLDVEKVAILMRARDEATTALQKLATKSRRVDVPVLNGRALQKLTAITKDWLKAETALTHLEELAHERGRVLHDVARNLHDAIAPIRDELRRIETEPTRAPASAGNGAVHTSPVAVGARVRAVAPASGGEATAGAGKAASTRGDASPRAVSGSSAPRPGITVGATPDPAARTTESVSGPQQRILDTLALLEQLQVARSRDTLAAWYGVHPNNKGFSNNLSALRTAGYVEGVELTEAGRAAAQWISAPTQEEARERIFKPLSSSQRRILDLLIERYPEGYGRDELAAQVGLHPNNKGFANNLSSLRTRQLVTRDWPIAAGKVLFL